jgi:hypothetical protein
MNSTCIPPGDSVTVWPGAIAMPSTPIGPAAPRRTTRGNAARTASRRSGSLPMLVIVRNPGPDRAVADVSSA